MWQVFWDLQICISPLPFCDVHCMLHRERQPGGTCRECYMYMHAIWMSVSWMLPSWYHHCTMMNWEDMWHTFSSFDFQLQWRCVCFSCCRLTCWPANAVETVFPVLYEPLASRAWSLNFLLKVYVAISDAENCHVQTTFGLARHRTPPRLTKRMHWIF